MLSEKSDFPITGQTPEGKKAKLDVGAVHGEPSQPSLSIPRFVALNPADCDLDFEIGFNGLLGSSLYEKGFAYCWSGARANAGIKRGKYCFGCKIISKQPVIMEDTPPAERHECRVGVSRGDNAVGSLGQSLHSFGFGGTGWFSSAGTFHNYGEPFGVGDTIVCCIDLETKPASIGFFKNGKWMGMSMQFEVVDSPIIKHLVWESAFFPHILLKNVVVTLQFSLEDGLEGVEGYKPWFSAIEDGKALPGPTFSEVHDCEVIMMVGLPSSGKSTWAEKWAKEHPEKRYIVLGTKLILDKMKGPGRLYSYGGRFERLMESATEVFNTLLPMASKLPRNLILDQTNVYKNARKRKLKSFLDYKKIAVVI
ncbi:PREDICTED: heterogeneous nuclear ribonucleoprotein U-like protein 1 [Ipomoea nil]|uniref:heterogeneous nuclear ribonucleoprotein U-like protein 1 n=1 Tax=Ipomoea nil TaxID=35883 RepID=UPI0009018CD3|nr:PREDICTED: heterogeneous nuclear ribonucleoprotein U-like protein 1 [Ipomoea nil]